MEVMLLILCCLSVRNSLLKISSSNKPVLNQQELCTRVPQTYALQTAIELINTLLYCTVLQYSIEYLGISPHLHIAMNIGSTTASKTIFFSRLLNLKSFIFVD